MSDGTGTRRATWVTIVRGSVGTAVAWSIFGFVIPHVAAMQTRHEIDVTRATMAALSAAIPIHLNWILNSLGDAAAIGLTGVLFLWLCFGRSDRAFRQWHWGGFVILLTWFIGQNLLVELFVYQTQLAEGLRLSWAPLIPTGPWYNPTILELGGKTVQLQTQLPWLLMTPIYYWMLIRIYNRYQV